MPGRFALTAAPESVARCFGLAAIDDFPPRPAILPTQPIMVVLGGRAERAEAFADGPAAQLVRWGLIPGWFKATDRLPAMFNAPAETAAGNPAFRGAMRHRRCLVPATAFYRRTGGRSRTGPLSRFSIEDMPVFAMAGLMEPYMAPDGSEIDTAAILTVPARAPDAGLVDRLPVILRPEDFGRWLDCRHREPGDVADLFRPFCAADFSVETAG
ncbi:SOS response-associated peptidase [Jiella avicenniae]|uniref:Abasic site processing protein n=1 Tax=Jiella avicenniae TaxID=2907202 RepID=A0A9X1P2W1_9HYPH|nr:SOS response-associated peptidase [Jiella avicenniae]MCE7029206.1 SOS response-associated peptidase [Jiella avicenniae]